MNTPHKKPTKEGKGKEEAKKDRRQKEEAMKEESLASHILDFSHVKAERRKGELLTEPQTRREWIVFFHEYRKVKQQNERLLREKKAASAKLEQTSTALAKTKRTKWILEKDQEILQNQHASLTTAHKSDLNHIERMEGTLTLFKESKAVSEERLYAKRCRSLHDFSKDQAFQAHFGLPPTEFQIGSFFASYEGTWGHLYLTPSFLCFDEGWSPYNTPCGTPHVLTMIKEVSRVNKTRAAYVAEAVGLLLTNGNVFSLLFLNSSSSFLQNLICQAQKFGVELEVSKKDFPLSPHLPANKGNEENFKGEGPKRHPTLSRSTTPPLLPSFSSGGVSFLVPPSSSSSINSNQQDFRRPRSSSHSSSSSSNLLLPLSNVPPR